MEVRYGPNPGSAGSEFGERNPLNPGLAGSKFSEKTLRAELWFGRVRVWRKERAEPCLGRLRERHRRDPGTTGSEFVENTEPNSGLEFVFRV